MKGPKMTKFVEQYKKLTASDLCTKQIWIQQQMTSTELQAPYIGHAHTELVAVKDICWLHTLPITGKVM